MDDEQNIPDLDDLLGSKNDPESEKLNQFIKKNTLGRLAATGKKAIETLTAGLRAKMKRILFFAIAGLIGLFIFMSILILTYGVVMSIGDKLRGWFMGGDEKAEDYYDYTEHLEVEEGEPPLDDDPYYTGAILRAMQEGHIKWENADLIGIDDSDFEHVLEYCVTHNEKKYEENEIYYTWFQEKYHEEDDTWYRQKTDPYENVLSSTVVKRMDIEGEKDEDGYYRFDTQWPLVLAVLNLASTSQADEWGKLGDSYEEGYDTPFAPDQDGYYFSDEQIEGLCEFLEYDFVYYYDAVADTGHTEDNPYLFEDFENGLGIGYRYDKSETDHDTSVGEYHIKYTPDIAPSKISNCYESYTYIYEDDPETGHKVCTGRRHKRDARLFIQIVLEYADKYNLPVESGKTSYDPGVEIFNHLIEMCVFIPHSDHVVKKLEMLKSEYINGIVIDEIEPADTGTEVISVGVHLGKGTDLSHKNTTVIEMDTAFQIWIGNWTNARTKKNHEVYDFYNVSVGANTDLTVSDGLSKEQVRAVLSYAEARATASGKNYKFTDATDAIYEWQERTGYSVTGLLAIMTHAEHGYTGINSNHYNFFNTVAGSGEAYFTQKPGGVHWKDWKKIYNNDIGAALAAQFDDIAKRYWGRGQNTYFTMCFNNWEGITYVQGGPPEGVTTQELENVQDWSVMTHCYCPWWDDTGYIQTSYNSDYGWCNKCASGRAELLSLAGK